MFNWLFKKTELPPNLSVVELRKLTSENKRAFIKSQQWTQEQIQDFVEKKFLPAAYKAAKNGYNCVDVYNILGSYYNLERYLQIRDYLVSLGYREIDTGFNIGW